MSGALYFVVDDKYVDVAVSQAARISIEYQIDTHIFVESVIPPEPEKYLELPDNLHFHHNKLECFLPSGLPQSDKWPHIVYLRIFVPQILKHYDRLIYIDADIYVAELPEIIWQIELPSGLAAVHDLGMIRPYIPGVKMPVKEWLKTIDLEECRYFNSGMLVIDVKKWLEIDFERLLPIHFEKYGKSIRMFDQDFLNHVFKKRWTELSPSWNFQRQIFYFGFEKTFKPYFYHFTDNCKPWHSNKKCYHHSYSDLYLEDFQKIGLDDQYNLLVWDIRVNWVKRIKFFIQIIIKFLSLRIRRRVRKKRERNENFSYYERFFKEALENKKFADVSEKELLVGDVKLYFHGSDFISPIYEEN